MIETEMPRGRKVNRRLKDYTGQKWGRLTALRLIERDERWNDHVWEFVCDCGSQKRARIKQVRSGHTSSCGCLFREGMRERNKTHGLSRSKAREYRSWKDMRSRCANPNDSDFADYGGRGIRVCDRWSDFASFYDDMGDRPKGATLDRVDVNGDYSPENCRWADKFVQANNRRSNVVLEMDGRAQTLMQWCREYGIDRTKVRYRLSRGMPLRDALKPGDLRGNGRSKTPA